MPENSPTKEHLRYAKLKEQFDRERLDFIRTDLEVEASTPR